MLHRKAVSMRSQYVAEGELLLQKVGKTANSHSSPFLSILGVIFTVALIMAVTTLAYLLSLTVLSSLGLASPTHGGSGAPTVTTTNGTVQGYYQATYNQDYFLGIPFAEPPVGDLRFRNPQSLSKPFDGVKVATEYYPECVGYGGDQLGYDVSEDCLALNIVRPAGHEGQNLPVGVWIHGGGYIMGGTPDKRYNLSFIVQSGVEIGKPIIGVSIPYRLSAWGFLDGNEVRSEGNTNVAMRDQRLALGWLQDNIGKLAPLISLRNPSTEH